MDTWIAFFCSAHIVWSSSVETHLERVKRKEKKILLLLSITVNMKAALLGQNLFYCPDPSSLKVIKIYL